MRHTTPTATDPTSGIASHTFPTLGNDLDLDAGRARRDHLLLVQCTRSTRREERHRDQPRQRLLPRHVLHPHRRQHRPHARHLHLRSATQSSTSISVDYTTGTSYADSTKVTVYQGGTLIWGTEP